MSLLLLKLLQGISISSKVLYVGHLWRSEVPAPLCTGAALSLIGTPKGR